MEFFLQLLVVFGLVLLNGYFVASEFALVGVRKTRIAELAKKGNKTAKLVQKALTDLDSVISATQLGITLASIGLGWIGEPAIAHFLEGIFQSILPADWLFLTSHTLAVILSFGFITFLHIVLGEVAPKTIALQKAEKTSLAVILPLTIFATVFKPFIVFLNTASSLLLKIFGFSAPSAHTLVHSEEEIKMLLSQSVEEGVIESTEAEMVYKVFQLGDIPIRHIMVPRTEAIAFEASATLKEVLIIIKKNIHSRFPVYEGSIDKIVGFIHIKDIYRSALGNRTNRKLSNSSIVREIMTLPEGKLADEALIEMRKKRVHMAVVSDEFGGTAGIVTMEDIIESLVGEIQDEFEKPLDDIHKQKDGSFIVRGLTSLEQFQKKFNLQIRGQGYMTIGGLVFGILGREPKVGDYIQIGNYRIEILKLKGKRIQTLLIKKITKKASP